VNVSGARPAGPLVSTAWLESNLRAPTLRIIDVRGEVLPPGNVPRYRAKAGDYAASHIPGARFLDWTRDIVDAEDRVPMQLASEKVFSEAMARVGVGDESVVVAYDDYNHIFAGRLAWALRYYGHEAAFVLDGGWSRWKAEGRPVSSEAPTSTSATFTARARPHFRRTAEEVSQALGRPDVLMVDARAPDQYVGRSSVARRSGHIPGARNVHYTKLIDASTGQFLHEAGLARAFAGAGVDVSHLPAEIIVYCNSGVSCTAVLNAFRLLGRDDVSVYDGSWNEWGNDEARPVTVGGDP
jgi:thiosulfate/3-mercaptopyruvate sulfurtransferase